MSRHLGVAGAGVAGVAVAGPRRAERGFTLLEVMVAVAISFILVSGMLLLLISHAQLSGRAFARNDIQNDGRAALRLLEEKISLAGLDLPRHYAIVDSVKDECGDRLTVASLDLRRTWKVSGTTANSISLTLDATSPQPGAEDIPIHTGRWVYLFASAAPEGLGMVRVSAERKKDVANLVVGSTSFYSVDQSSVSLEPGSALDGSASSPTSMLLADVSTFGVDCSDAEHPYIYYRQGDGEAVPLASYADTTPLPEANSAIAAAAGDVVSLRFRFLLDEDEDGQPDDTVPTPLKFSVDPAEATNDNVYAVEVLMRLRSAEPDPQTGEYRTRDFVQLIRTENIQTRSDKYIFVSSEGI